MAESSSIEWTDATVNFWWGCTKVGPGCDHCYAESLNAFRGNGQWGAGAPRRKIKGALAMMASLDRRPWMDELGRRRRVFMSSMCDVFDNEVDPEWRMEAYYSAQHATNLDIQMLTKRISNVAKMVPPDWTSGYWPRHIGLMITVVNQQEADRDVPRLLMLKQQFGIPWVGLSCEPLLGPIDLRSWLQHLDWVIGGGESGKDARPMHPNWISSLRDQCGSADVPFLFKQWGEWGLSEESIGSHIAHAVANDGSLYRMTDLAYPNGARRVEALDAGHDHAALTAVYRVGKKAAGRMLDGVEHIAFPRVAA